MKVTKASCLIDERSTGTQITGLAQLFEVPAGQHNFWFGIAQLDTVVSDDKPLMPCVSDYFQIEFDGERAGMAVMRSFVVMKEYVELTFIGYTSLLNKNVS